MYEDSSGKKEHGKRMARLWKVDLKRKTERAFVNFQYKLLILARAEVSQWEGEFSVLLGIFCRTISSSPKVQIQFECKFSG